MTRLLLGVDGGGTKTHSVIIDEKGRFLGQGFGGPSNYDDVGVEATQAGIAQAVDAARHAAGMPHAQFAAAFLGMAGVVSPTDRSIISEIADTLNLAPANAISVDHDCRIALAGGLAGRPGMVQIAGTGSSTFGINAAGQSWRAGGWGQLLADEGSGYWLGVQAMKTAVRAYDGRQSHKLLLEKVQNHLQLAHMNDIMHRIYGAGLSRAEIAALAPLVIEAAQEDDKVACDLIDQGTQLLADCVLAVANKLGFVGESCELAMVGGMFEAGEVFNRPFTEAVSDRLPLCHHISAELPPVLGACVLSLQRLNIEMDDTLLHALSQAATSISK